MRVIIYSLVVSGYYILVFNLMLMFWPSFVDSNLPLLASVYAYVGYTVSHRLLTTNFKGEEK